MHQIRVHTFDVLRSSICMIHWCPDSNSGCQRSLPRPATVTPLCPAGFAVVLRSCDGRFTPTRALATSVGQLLSRSSRAPVVHLARDVVECQVQPYPWRANPVTPAPIHRRASMTSSSLRWAHTGRQVSEHKNSLGRAFTETAITPQPRRSTCHRASAASADRMSV